MPTYTPKEIPEVQVDYFIDENGWVEFESIFINGKIVSEKLVEVLLEAYGDEWTELLADGSGELTETELQDLELELDFELDKI